jgi:hypothetical protein
MLEIGGGIPIFRVLVLTDTAHHTLADMSATLEEVEETVVFVADADLGSKEIVDCRTPGFL